MGYKIRLTGKKGFTKSKTSYKTFKTKKEAQEVVKLSRTVPSFDKKVKKYTIIKIGKRR